MIAGSDNTIYIYVNDQYGNPFESDIDNTLFTLSPDFINDCHVNQDDGPNILTYDCPHSLTLAGTYLFY